MSLSVPRAVPIGALGRGVGGTPGGVGVMRGGSCDWYSSDHRAAARARRAERLVKQFDLTCIGTGDILRAAIASGSEMGRTVKPLIDQGLLVPDPIVNDLVAELFRGPNRPERFVMDGYPRTYSQAISFDALLRQEFLAIDAW